MERDTLIELDFGHAVGASQLFAGATYDRVFVDAFYESRQPGRLFVDDGRRPTAAMLCRTYEYFFAGEPVPAIRQFVRDAPREAGLFSPFPDLATARTGAMLGFYGMVAISAAWNHALLADHAGQLEVIGRRTFTLPIAAETWALAWPERVPAGVAVLPIDVDLAKRVDVELDELIGLFWSGYERFGRHGFGAVAMMGDEIASTAYTVATSAHEINIGVGTAERYRRRGLATLASNACIAMALERGLRPTWDCDETNPASADLARKLGFAEQPSFVELAFPHRAGPNAASGVWSPSPHPLGRRWQPSAA
jgi:RimJ/RimL family protein N-acetyltransferase